MARHAGYQTVLADVLDHFANPFDLALLNKLIAHAPVQIRADGPVVYGAMGVAGQVPLGRLGLGDPLDFAAPLLAIAVQDANGIVVHTQDGGIDPLGLA